MYLLEKAGVNTNLVYIAEKLAADITVKFNDYVNRTIDETDTEDLDIIKEKIQENFKDFDTWEDKATIILFDGTKKNIKIKYTYSTDAEEAGYMILGSDDITIDIYSCLDNDELYVDETRIGSTILHELTHAYTLPIETYQKKNPKVPIKSIIMNDIDNDDYVQFKDINKTMQQSYYYISHTEQKSYIAEAYKKTYDFAYKIFNIIAKKYKIRYKGENQQSLSLFLEYKYIEEITDEVYDICKEYIRNEYNASRKAQRDDSDYMDMLYDEYNIFINDPEIFYALNEMTKLRNQMSDTYDSDSYIMQEYIFNLHKHKKELKKLYNISSFDDYVKYYADELNKFANKILRASMAGLSDILNDIFNYYNTYTDKDRDRKHRRDY